jgi:flagellar assembly factor FliW
MTEGTSVATMTITEAAVTESSMRVTVEASQTAEIEPAAVPTIEFVSAMPGFPGHHSFVLVRLGDEGQLYALTSLADPALRFLVIAPGIFFPEYAPEIDDQTVELLEVTDTEQLLVLLVVSATSSLADATANLLAPIIVDQSTRRAVQVVLNGSGLPVRAPLIGG